MICEAEVEGREPMDIAREWIENNRDKVNEWLTVK
jgi:ABC-type proline/glycine betaine transport system substrate-binding protein